MRHIPGTVVLIAVLLALAHSPVVRASGALHARATVHIKRVGDREMTLTGRTPASAGVTVTLVNARGRFLAKLGLDAGAHGRYSACVVAPRQAFRAIVTTQGRGGELRKRSRLVPARRRTDRPGCLPPDA